MAVWTISAEEGTGGARIAANLAESAGARLLDRAALAHLARRFDAGLEDDLDGLEEQVGGRFNLLAISMAIMAGSADAVRALRLQQALPGLARAIAAEVSCEPCVIVAPGAFAALPLHHSAVHVRLWAPLQWRIAAYQREHVVDRRRAERAVRHDDRSKRAWVHSIYGIDVTDGRPFSVSVDVSRFATDRVVELLLAAAGAPVLVA